MTDVRVGSNLTSMLERQLLGRQQSAEAKNSFAERSQATTSTRDSQSFLETLKDAVNEANNLQKEADQAAQNFAKGQGSLHESMIALEKADISLRTITQVRGKLIDAYQEVMRMPV